VNLNGLEQYLLKKYCRKYGLDYQEVDSSITYWENFQHLKGLVNMLCNTLDGFEIARMEELQEEYVLNHPLEYFMSYRNPRKRKAKVQTDSTPAEFSLRQMKAINHGFSLKTLIAQ
jgi:hypothetical protein